MRQTFFSTIRLSCFLMIAIFVLSLSANIFAQNDPDRTVGLIAKDSLAFEGYTLFTPISNTTTYLINNDGLLVHSWESGYKPGQSVYLLEDGNLLRTANVNNSTFHAGGSGGRVQLFEWDGTLVWDYLYSGSDYCQHHDVEFLPNGNVLLISWERKFVDEAIAMGRNPELIKDNELWPDYIIEVKPNSMTEGEIVWEWHIWDHLIQDYDPSKANYGVIADHPELVDLNFVLNGPNAGNADWNHTNSVAYNEEFDQIMLSVHNFNEIWIIDHSTTIEQAADHEGGRYGKGGDILYRWGNPQTYRAGSAQDQKLFGQHDAHWVESGCPGAGHILVFNNGAGRNYSTVEEIVPPVDSTGHYSLTIGSAYGPVEQQWIYSADNPTDLFAQNISGAQRLSNGNTLICSGPNGIFFEVTPNNDIVWHYVNPVGENGPLTQGSSPAGSKNMVFKIRRYAATYAGLAGRDLSPGEPIEIYPTNVKYNSGEVPLEFKLQQNYPNPFNPSTTIEFSLPQTIFVSLKIYNLWGEEVATLVSGILATGLHKYRWEADGLAGGVYLYQLKAGTSKQTKKLILLR